MKCIMCSCGSNKEDDIVEGYCNTCLSDDLDIILLDENTFSLIIKRFN